MLFDLRSRGRRTTVRVIYSGLAVLMFGGLVLFGVGAGNGFGGLVNAFTNNGSGGNAVAVVNAQLKSAEKAAKANPNATTLAALLEAQYTNASEAPNYDSNTVPPSFTKGGLAGLRDLTTTWTKLLAVNPSPSAIDAELAAKAYSALGNYSGEASAWEVYVGKQPDELGFECLAASAYAANQTRKGDLAAAQAVKLAPAINRLQVKAVLKSARTSPVYAGYSSGC